VGYLEDLIGLGLGLLGLDCTGYTLAGLAKRRTENHYVFKEDTTGKKIYF
jgi:hypothetical protein